MEEIQAAFGSLALSKFPSAKIKADELFLQWLSSSEGASAVLSVLDEHVKGYSSLSSPSSSSSMHNDGPLPNGRGSTMEPPRSPHRKSPKKRTQTEMQQEHAVSASSSSNNHNVTGESQDDAMMHVSKTAEMLMTGPASRQNHESSSSSMMTEDTIGGIVGMDGEGKEYVDRNNHTRHKAIDVIPPFYTPAMRSKTGSIRSVKNRGHSDSSEGVPPILESRGSSSDNPNSLEKHRRDIEDFFRPFPHGAPLDKFVHATKRLCGLPSFFNAPLVRRINALYDPSGGADWGRSGGPRVMLSTFLDYWRNEIEPYDRTERFFRVIKQPHHNHIVKDDFVPFLQELLHFHPGLDFLENHEEFQKKYALTVIVRIFYQCNTSRTGRLTLKEVINANLSRAFMHVDEENDINRVREYFSYEHFYVLYCRFFELDVDKDTKLSVEDVLRYSDHTLSETIVDRIFQVGQRVFSDGKEGGFGRNGMAYPDFVYMMLAEEDKTSITSLRYWFACCDLDSDGILTPEELNSFYRVQLARALNLGQEQVLFKDILCQLVDLIDPKNPRAITIDDLIYPPEKRLLSGVLFDVLFNLQKFLRFETRDPFQEKLKREDGFQTEWDRYAAFEYQRLAQEDTVYDDMDVEAEQNQLQHMEESGYAFEGGPTTAGYSAAVGNSGVQIGIDDDDDSDELQDGMHNNHGSGRGNGGNRRSRGGRKNGEKVKDSSSGARSSRNQQISNRRK
jgi:serine/threonine-protein phosphatase 2A regulatory subunit B''